MEKKLILRGAIAGAAAGLIAFVFARIFAEPQIQAAIDYESDSVAAQVVLWSAIGLLFGPMAERLLQPKRSAAPAEAVRGA
jgi:hypothetical protein